MTISEQGSIVSLIIQSNIDVVSEAQWRTIDHNS
jgi:hypothetical protein